MLINKQIEIEQEFISLQQAFKQQLPMIISAIKKLLEYFSVTSDDKNNIKKLHDNLRSLSGSAGTYGAARVS